MQKRSSTKLNFNCPDTCASNSSLKLNSTDSFMIAQNVTEKKRGKCLLSSIVTGVASVLTPKCKCIFSLIHYTISSKGDDDLIRPLRASRLIQQLEVWVCVFHTLPRLHCVSFVCHLLLIIPDDAIKLFLMQEWTQRYGEHSMCIAYINLARTKDISALTHPTL